MQSNEHQHRADDDVTTERATQTEEPAQSPAAPIARILANPSRTRRA